MLKIHARIRSLAECFKSLSQAFGALGAQGNHFADKLSTLLPTGLLQLISEHLIFFLMVVIMGYPMLQPNSRFFYNIHGRNLPLSLIPRGIANVKGASESLPENIIKFTLRNVFWDVN
jgi:hypothetical protein